MDDFKILNIFNNFASRNVVGATPPKTLNAHMTFLVDKIDMWRFPKQIITEYAYTYMHHKTYVASVGQGWKMYQTTGPLVPENILAGGITTD